VARPFRILTEFRPLDWVQPTTRTKHRQPSPAQPADTTLRITSRHAQ